MPLSQNNGRFSERAINRDHSVKRTSGRNDAPKILSEPLTSSLLFRLRGAVYIESIYLHCIVELVS